ncbi:MAG TPA: methyl-accepting chemotaxis protein [Steroidobacteraceae bacterium]|nr:methyl-accepting chemotaxis protein [Steroidobacteraceae bacterium]
MALFESRYQSKFTIGSRLGVAFGTLFLYTALLVVFSIHQQSKLHTALQHHDSQAVPTAQMLNIMTDVQTVGLHAMRLVSASDSSESARWQNQLRVDCAKVENALQGYRQVAVQDHSGVQYDAVAERIHKYLGRIEAVAGLAANGQREAATQMLLSDAEQTLDSPHDEAGAWAQANAELAKNSMQDGEEVYRRGVTFIVIVAALVLISAIVSAVRMTGSIIGPLRRAAEQARRVARGDLTQRLEVSGRDEICELFNDLNQMTSQLANLISDVVGSAVAVESTATSLAQTVTELSQRTQQQAAHLRETAGSMQQITQLGQSNSENAANADRLGSHARELAENGGQVVTQAVSAMSDINKGSSKIANILGLIDEIAFQTNLLALNAAVEAARAGDQGRGFAVVAAEVRALAQRSADAAKQIKGLINDSAGSVRVGTELVDRTGNALSQIQTSVRDMTTLIKQIADSSQEQAIDARRINQAMLQIDSATQQYATWIDQGASAARALREHADVLAKHASYFTLGEGAARSMPPAPPALEERSDPSAAWPDRMRRAS